MDQEPKLPDPQIDPQQVADAILHAAVHGDRAIKVGAMSKLNTTIANLMPGIGDKMSVAQADRQHYDEAPRSPEGALEHTANTGNTHGSGGVQKK